MAQVKEYLQMYFEKTRRIVGTENQDNLVELCLLFVHCLEVSSKEVVKVNNLNSSLVESQLSGPGT